MSWIIKVDNLSKVYRIGAGVSQNGTLYEQVSKRLKSYFPGKIVQTNREPVEQTSEHRVLSDAQSEGLPPGFFWALKDISFEVNPGDRLGLIGQNGSGKSTLLKILSRITTQSHGDFRYRGHLISLLEVGTGFHPELTGRENVFLNAAINGMSRQQIKARFDEIVDFSEIGSQIDTPVKRYSSGMYTRLAFSVAAFLESEILLIDEVLAVGDQAFQKKCKEKMLEVANDGRSVIFVSHDMNAIESICKKTIELSHGQIVNIKEVLPKTDPEKENSSDHLIEPLDLSNSNKSAHFNKELSENNKRQLCAEHIFSIESDNSMIKNEKLQFISAKVWNAQECIQDIYTVNEDLNIELRFKVLKPDSLFNIQVSVSTLEGVLLFSSMDHHHFNSQNARRDRGEYKEVVTIPGNYLNSGTFIISFYVYDHDSQEHSISYSDCLTIRVIDNLLPVGVRSNWLGSWPHALLRPDLKWHIEYKEQNYPAPLHKKEVLDMDILV